MKSKISYVVAALAAILASILLLFACIELISFNLPFYRDEYRKLNRPAVIGISENDLMQVTQGLLQYLKDQRKDLVIQANIKGVIRKVFNEKEMQHMADVKVLFTKGYIFRNIILGIFIALLILLWVLARNRTLQLFARSLFWTCIAFLLGIIMLILLLNSDFTKYFEQFHYLFFSNDLWQLDPRTDVLIQIVPEEFFTDISFRIISIYMGTMLTLAIASRVYVHASKQK